MPDCPEYPVRKRNRLPEFDYSSPHAYFITICADKRQHLFGQIVGATVGRPPEPLLTPAGKVVQTAISAIPVHYPAYIVEHSVIMPNHVHLLLRIRTDEGGRPIVAPTVSTVIAQMKGIVSKQLGMNIWQKGFHDHVIRTADDFREVWEYIENNPVTWAEDMLFTP